MKFSPIILFIILISTSCSKQFKVTDHYDPGLPFEIIDMEKPDKDGAIEIQIDDSKKEQLLSWFALNNRDWKPTHNTNAGLIIVSQGDFKLLFYRDNDFVVVGFTDDENVRHQYIKFVDSNELSFLVED